MKFIRAPINAPGTSRISMASSSEYTDMVIPACWSVVSNFRTKLNLLRNLINTTLAGVSGSIRTFACVCTAEPLAVWSISVTFFFF